MGNLTEPFDGPAGLEAIQVNKAFCSIQANLIFIYSRIIVKGIIDFTFGLCLKLHF